MKIDILKSTVGDKRPLKAGVTGEEVTEQTGLVLIALGKAKPHVPAPEKKRKPKDE